MIPAKPSVFFSFIVLPYFSTAHSQFIFYCRLLCLWVLEGFHSGSETDEVVWPGLRV